MWHIYKYKWAPHFFKAPPSPQVVEKKAAPSCRSGPGPAVSHPPPRPRRRLRPPDGGPVARPPHAVERGVGGRRAAAPAGQRPPDGRPVARDAQPVGHVVAGSVLPVRCSPLRHKFSFHEFGNSKVRCSPLRHKLSFHEFENGAMRGIKENTMYVL